MKYTEQKTLEQINDYKLEQLELAEQREIDTIETNIELEQLVRELGLDHE